MPTDAEVAILAAASDEDKEEAPVKEKEKEEFTTHTHEPPRSTEKDEDDDTSDELTCDIKTIKALSKAKENPRGVVVVFTHPDCDHCLPTLKDVKETVGKNIPIINAGLEDEKCVDLAEDLDIGKTPTILYYKGGKKLEKFTPGRSYEKGLERLGVAAHEHEAVKVERSETEKTAK